MPFYWSLKSIPELADLPAAERKRLWKKVRPQADRYWRWWVGIVGAAIILSVVSIVVGFSFDGAPLYLTWAVWFVLMYLFSTLCQWVMLQIEVPVLLPHLRRELGHLCLKCGYSLIGNVSGVCPECGTPRQAPEAISSGRAG